MTEAQVREYLEKVAAILKDMPEEQRKKLAERLAGESA